MHHRLTPKKNRFTYNLFLFCLDLDEIDSVCANTRGLSHNRFNLYTFKDRDHLTVVGGDDSVKQNLTAYLAHHGVDFPENGRAILLTLPAGSGLHFQPRLFLLLL
jgi:uncharacterized protein